MRAFVALTVIVLSASVSAQTDSGFFRPTPNNDPSLTHPPVITPRTPEPFLGRAPAMVQVPVPVPVPAPVPATTVVAEEAVQKAEAETERAQREAEEAARKAAATPTPAPDR